MKNWLFGFGICLVIVTWSLVFAAPAHAVNFTATGNPDDTLAGTVITAFSTEETLNYTDINDNPKPEVNPTGNLQVTVLPVYGFSFGYTRTPMVTGEGESRGYIGQTRYTYIGITNEGNASDTYTLTAEAVYTLAGAGTWTIEVRRTADDSLIGTLTPGSPSTVESVAVAEDATYLYYLKVTYPTTGALPEDKLTINVSCKTSSTPVGQYTGANGLTYGGISSLGPAPTEWLLLKPVLAITDRRSVVDAPKSPFGGGATSPVPGSIISYRTTYSNTGNTSAEGVIFVDKVPAYTNLAHFNKTGNTANVTLTTNITNRSGDWTIWYSTQASPQKTYNDSTGWTMVGTLDATASNSFPGGEVTYILGTDAQANATWIKWEKVRIPSTEDDKTITWGTTIR